MRISNSAPIVPCPLRAPIEAEDVKHAPLSMAIRQQILHSRSVSRYYRKMRVSEISTSTVISRNIVIEIAPMAAMVNAALRAVGFGNAGTPLEMASAPVSAVHPD